MGPGHTTGSLYRLPIFTGNSVDLGDKRAGVLLSIQQPRIAYIDGFLDDAECAALIALAEGRLHPSKVYATHDTGKRSSPARTSWDAELRPAEDERVARIERRAAILAGCPDSHGQPLDIIRYQPGQQYRPHYDWFDPRTVGGLAQIEEAGQRVATVVMYLNEGMTGGSTVFPRMGLDFRPKQGAALFFSNLDDRGEPDRLTLHAGAPVMTGEKVIATRWFRDRPRG